jgi:hypothetical protein
LKFNQRKCFAARSSDDASSDSSVDLFAAQTLGEKLEQGGVQLALGAELRRVRGEERQDFPIVGHVDPRPFPRQGC